MEKYNVMFVFVPDACRQMNVSFLNLFVKHRALQLPRYLFSSLVETFLEYRIIYSKKIFYRLSNRYCNPVNCCYKTRFFKSILLLRKSQQMGILQRLVDKCIHLFICKVDISISQQMTLATIFYFGQCFAYRRVSQYEQFC